MAGVQQRNQTIAGLIALVAQTFVDKLHFMGQIAYRANLGHTRTALEGMQITLQCFHCQRVTGVGNPLLQAGCGAVDDFLRFLEEDINQFGIGTRFTQAPAAACRSCRRGRRSRGRLFSQRPGDQYLQRAQLGISRQQMLMGSNLIHHADQPLMGRCQCIQYRLVQRQRTGPKPLVYLLKGIGQTLKWRQLDLRCHLGQGTQAGSQLAAVEFRRAAGRAHVEIVTDVEQ